MVGYFYGWYLKCQSDTQAFAVIPAIHGAKQKQICSIQFITEEKSWTISYPVGQFHQGKQYLSIGENYFGAKGIRLAVHTEELEVEGKLRFGPLSPLNYDIMGPFAMVPFLECYHSVWSMRHPVYGTVVINGQEYRFRHGCGYWEGDRGYSFPDKYLWTQCCFPSGSIMLSVANIPLSGLHFVGIIGVVLWQGQEYRFATYLGARVASIHNKRIRIVQGDMELEVHLSETAGCPLKAPVQGNMTRMIYESVACRASYRFRKNQRTLLALETKQASFEYQL